MKNSNIEDKIKEINIENIIWIIYIGIIILSWYSNSLEKKYFLYNDLNCKEKYQKTLIIIFSILIIIYLYFLKSSWDSVQELNINDSKEKRELVNLSFLASLLIVISGFIYLYIAHKDKNIYVELAFN